MTSPIAVCTPKRLPPQLHVSAARRAIQINPMNRPAVERAASLAAGSERPESVMTPERLAVMVTKYWQAGKVDLTVSFMENAPAALQDRILAHMNAWSAFCNVHFHRVNSGGQVRISLGGGGYWSYLGTDILSIPMNQQTMNLEGFDMTMPESEFVRVVRHETGHSLGFPHEHMRRQEVVKLDAQKTIAYFMRTQGWTAQEVRDQVLTPLDEASIRGTPEADDFSIMCYQIPGECTVSGQPIPGGMDIDATDRTFAAACYPPQAAPPPGPPPHPAGAPTLAQAQSAAVAAIESVAQRSWFSSMVRACEKPVADALARLWQSQ